MLKIMIIKYQQFAKTNTFSLSFHILFSPFFPETHRNQDLGMGKNGKKWGWTPQTCSLNFCYTVKHHLHYAI